ncbi:transketolase family protein [Gammaproteobacteria bacterium]|nr:transketolase family protein [Gammaproteobacteria bacterium]
MSRSIRVGYGEHITKLGHKNKDLILLEADLADSTQSEPFQIAFPDRHFQIGIAEQNMVGMAAGLSQEGKLPVVNSFAAFIAMRACEQVRTDVAYPNLNVKFVVSHAGVSAGSAGPTHHTYEDIAIMRSIPNMSVFVPGDVREMRQIIDAAIKLEGPAYVRISAIDIPDTYSKEDNFEIGKATLLNDGDDLTLITTGTMMFEASQVVKNLKEHSINARLLQMASIKPIDRQSILKAAKETNKIFSIEEHNIIGGLGSAVAEVLAEENVGKLVRIGFNDVFCSTGGDPAFLLDSAGLSVEKLTKKILSEIS